MKIEWITTFAPKKQERKQLEIIMTKLRYNRRCHDTIIDSYNYVVIVLSCVSLQNASERIFQIFPPYLFDVMC